MNNGEHPKTDIKSSEFGYLRPFNGPEFGSHVKNECPIIKYLFLLVFWHIILKLKKIIFHKHQDVQLIMFGIPALTEFLLVGTRITGVH